MTNNQNTWGCLWLKLRGLRITRGDLGLGYQSRSSTASAAEGLAQPAADIAALPTFQKFVINSGYGICSHIENHLQKSVKFKISFQNILKLQMEQGCLFI